MTKTITGVDPGMGRDKTTVTVFVCEGDLVERWAIETYEDQRREYELEADLAVEQLLGPHPSMDGNFEAADVEIVPIDWAEL